MLGLLMNVQVRVWSISATHCCLRIIFVSRCYLTVSDCVQRYDWSVPELGDTRDHVSLVS